MPAGLPTGKYLKLLGTSFIFMFLGAQFVHNIYKPLDGLDEFIEKYKEEQKKQTAGGLVQAKNTVSETTGKT